MKKILILILVTIILIFAYNQYQNYKRYHPKNTDYKVNEAIDSNYHNQDLVFKYYQAVESLNSYVTIQWSANEIDVLNPEDDNNATNDAVKEYSKKLAKVKYYEAKLKASNNLKRKGLSNSEIKYIEDFGITADEANKKQITADFKQMMLNNLPTSKIRNGQKSAYIYEIQKLLKAIGYDIPLDGVFKNITAEAIKNFEEKNNLLADGVIDRFTVKVLLNK